MDPKQTLIDCDQAISDCDLELAEELLSYYDTWRAKHGYQPEVHGHPGDKFAWECRRRIESQRAQEKAK